MNSSNALRKVIPGCIDEQRMLAHESWSVNAYRSGILDRVASERRRFAEEVRGLSGARGGAPNHGSWAELGRELGRELRVALGGASETDAIAACRRACSRTQALMDQALDLPLSEVTRAAIVAQRKRVDADSNALIAIQF